MQKNLAFRAWYYFRQGWSIYFAFIIAATNTMVTTYYLAIEKSFFLKEIFPSFISYFLILVVVAIPTLIAIGYIHTKKSQAYQAEIDIHYEVNPYARRMLDNTEEILRQQYMLNKIIFKLAKNEKLTEKEFEFINQIKNKSEEL